MPTILPARATTVAALLVCSAVLALLTSVPGAPAAGRIANGAGVSDERHDVMWPFIVSIGETGKAPYASHSCGGSLIHPRLVLTAAHCVDDGTAPVKRLRSIPGSLSIFAGSPHLDQPGSGQRVRVLDTLVHRGYGKDPSRWNDDIAILRLARPVKLSARIGLGTVVGAGEDTLWGSGLGRADETDATGPFVAGWGNTLVWEPRHVAPKQLQEVRVPIVADHACSTEAAPGVGATTAEFLCAGMLDDDADPSDGSVGRDACSGDSGGPLVAGDGAGAWRIVGLVSHGETCAGNYYLAYVRVAAYRDWIASVRPAPGTGAGGIATPSRVRTTKRTRTTITIDWRPVPGAKSYVVYGDMGDGQLQRWATSRTTTARITGFDPDVETDLYVVARSKSGDESPMRRHTTWTLP